MDPGVLRHWFDEVDSDRNGRISSLELQRALQLGGLNFSVAICAQLIRIHDQDNSHALNFHEFCGMHQFLDRCNANFFYFDKSRTGQLVRSEVREALAHNGFPLDEPVFEKLFTVFDPDRSNGLAVTEFIAMNIFLASCNSTFGAFSGGRSAQITLDLQQFIYAAANTR
ncbi:unnamed protein product [Pedinophyceae sp. YPF-701]|nr:unnamed protein product [Pedinophyceae sp. YPF-701]